jgi:hypothetical protein
MGRLAKRWDDWVETVNAPTPGDRPDDDEIFGDDDRSLWREVVEWVVLVSIAVVLFLGLSALGLEDYVWVIKAVVVVGTGSAGLILAVRRRRRRHDPDRFRRKVDDADSRHRGRDTLARS